MNLWTPARWKSPEWALDECHAFGQSCFFQGLIGRGQRELFAESQVDVGNVVDSQIVLSRQSFQRDVVEPFSAYNPDRKGFQKLNVGVWGAMEQ